MKLCNAIFIFLVKSKDSLILSIQSSEMYYCFFFNFMLIRFLYMRDCGYRKSYAIELTAKGINILAGYIYVWKMMLRYKMKQKKMNKISVQYSHVIRRKETSIRPFFDFTGKTGITLQTLCSLWQFLNVKAKGQ